MIDIALMDIKERELLFRETARVSGLSEAIIEKDFWVCFMLKHLFVSSKFKNDIYFKGGTSLSKCYGLIQRFSEDIDIILNWTFLGYTEGGPWQDRSNTAQEKLNEEINRKTSEFLESIFVPTLKDELEKQGFDAFKLEIDENDGLTVLFTYPAIYDDKYIVPRIRLEIGALAARLPIEEKVVTPYIEDYLKESINGYGFKVNVISAVRTLFEKITILHGETNRISNHPIRYARHYYDVYKMVNTLLLNEALANIELLKDVVEFKMKFYRSPRSKYEEILEGNLRLVPSNDAIKVFEKDYEEMKQMFFGDIPEFNDIIKKISDVQAIFNKQILIGY